MNFPTNLNTSMDLTLTLDQMKSSQALKSGLLDNAKQAGIGSASGDMLKEFGNLLNDEMQKMSHLENNAKETVQDFAMGKDVPMHQVVMSIEKSDMAFKMAAQVRNHMVRAYREISQMNV